MLTIVLSVRVFPADSLVAGEMKMLEVSRQGDFHFECLIMVSGFDIEEPGVPGSGIPEFHYHVALGRAVWLG